MKKTVSILSLLVLLLGVWAAALWLSPFNAYNGSSKETRYGVHEGLELVEQENAQEGKRYVVEDEDGKELFVIPLRGCLLDTRYRNGQLRFREKNTKREGYIDRQGRIFLNENAGEYKPAEDRKDFANLMGEKKGLADRPSAIYWRHRLNRNRRISCICPTRQEVKRPLAGKSQDDGAEQSLL